MCRLQFIIVMIAVLSFTVRSDEPNLIVIMTDEHNLRTLGCYRDIMKYSQSFIWGKGVKVDTPHIDSLARDGALFTNFNTVAPLCTPSRASFMTGLYPAIVGVNGNHQPMNENAKTFAEILRKKKGYHTGYIGKWHLNGEAKPGFDDKRRSFGFLNTKYQFNRGHWKYFEEDPNGNIDAYIYDDRNKVKGDLNDAYSTDFLFEKAFDFINAQIERERHFALMLSIPDPHGPNVVRPPYDTMFDRMKFSFPATGIAAYHKTPANPVWSKLDNNIKNADQSITSIENDERWQTSFRNYFGMVKLIDDKVGELLSLLKKRGQDDNTIIVFTSDHGDLMGEHGKYNKGKPYKTSAGVPFIIRYPNKIKKGKIVETAYSSPDFAPTILKIMGFNLKFMNFQGIDGSDEILDDNMFNNRKQVRFMTDSKSARWAAAVDREYKLVLSRNTPLLYDLKKDPDELYNFHGAEEYKNITETLEVALADAMGKYDFPLAEAKIVFVDRPACEDSNDQIPALPYQVCSDLQEEPVAECELDQVSNMCPNVCGTCCEDSRGEIRYLGDTIHCDKVKVNRQKYCENWKISLFCPVTCSECVPEPSSGPSAIRSSLPSQMLPQSPSVIPTVIQGLIPSQTPSQTPSQISSQTPSQIPSQIPSQTPSQISSQTPSQISSQIPSQILSQTPSQTQSQIPSQTPSQISSQTPSLMPSLFPSKDLSMPPSELNQPSLLPSSTASTMNNNCFDSPLTVDPYELNCSYLASNQNYCNNVGVKSHCPSTCNACAQYGCADSEMNFIYLGVSYQCTALQNVTDTEAEKYCEIEDVTLTCRASCKICKSIKKA